MANFAIMRFDHPDEEDEDPDNFKVVPALKELRDSLQAKVANEDGQVKELAKNDGVKLKGTNNMSVKQYNDLKNEAKREMEATFPELAMMEEYHPFEEDGEEA